MDVINIIIYYYTVLLQLFVLYERGRIEWKICDKVVLGLFSNLIFHCFESLKLLKFARTHIQYIKPGSTIFQSKSTELCYYLSRLQLLLGLRIDVKRI